MKKELQIKSSFVMLFMLLTLVTNAQHTVDDYVYELITTTQDGAPPITNAKIVDYLGTKVYLNIPSEVLINGTSYTVNEIGDSAFLKELSGAINRLDSITIPNTIVEIGDSAFRWNSLSKVNFEAGSNLTYIRTFAFADNVLTSIEIPDPVIIIEQDAFFNNELQSVHIPNSLESIGKGVFKSNNLTSVEIPNSVTHIENSAFAVNNLQQVIIPESVASIDIWAFSNNYELSEVIVKNPTDPPVIDAQNGNLFTISFHAQQNPAPLDFRRDVIDLIVPVGSVRAYTNWNGNDFFKSIREESFIEDNIRYKITALSDIKETVLNGGGIVRRDDRKEVTIDLYIGGAFLEGDLNIAETITNTTDAENYTITAIGNNAFANNKFTSVTITEHVKSIGVWAFSNNDNLTTVEVKSIVPPSVVDTDNNFSIPEIMERVFTGNASEDRRGEIDLIVPEGTESDYLAHPLWSEFKSIRENASTLSVNANDSKDFTIFPNPVNDRINIQLNNGQNLEQVKIFNVLGTHLYTVNTSQIDISHLSNGMYLLELISKEGNKAVKRIIKK